MSSWALLYQRLALLAVAIAAVVGAFVVAARTVAVMFRYLSRRFGPTIDLDVSRERFRFRCGEAEEALEPLCGFNRKGQVNAVGSEARSITVGHVVEFFAEPHRRGREWPHERALELFCCYGLMLVQVSARRGRCFSPNVRVTGSRELRERLDRVEKEVLRRALIAAGAASVTFPDVQPTI